MGGMQKHSRLLSEFLAREGMRVILYHFVLPSSSLPSDNEVINSFGKEARGNIEIRTFLYPEEDSFPSHYLRAQQKVGRAYRTRLEVEDEEPCFIYAKGFMAYDIQSIKGLFPTVPIGVKFHGMNMFQKQPDFKGEITKYLFRGRVRRIMNEADYIFSYGGKISEIIRREVSDANKIVEFPSGIGADWLTEHSRAGSHGVPIRALFVGRWDRLKGLQELFDVLSNNPEMQISLTLVGPIPTKEIPKDSRVNVIGRVDSASSLRNIYDEHDVLVCPSVSEGMPNVILEAMARGLAVICTDVGASSILVDASNGWLIEPRNKSALRDALNLAIQETDLSVLGMNGLNRVKTDFNWQNIARNMMRWMGELKS